MNYERPRWKEDWERSAARYERWWNHEGSIIVFPDLPLPGGPRETPIPLAPSSYQREQLTNAEWFARDQRNRLARFALPGDTLPIAHVDYGCVQLAAVFGCEPTYNGHTVWYDECISDPESTPELRLTGKEKWWNVYRNIMLELCKVSGGDFLVGAPAFGSNLDVLAELRGTQHLLYDLVDRPDWVKQKLSEINRAFFAAFDDYYQYIRLADGRSAYTFFHILGTGKTSQVQCDCSAMISPDMFLEFVVPPLLEQCAWLDHSLFHLDGLTCLGHLDHLLAIPELDAVQWTPGAGQPEGGDAKWHDIYRRILDAGKSVQIVQASSDQARHIIDTFGPRGVYVTVHASSVEEAETCWSSLQGEAEPDPLR